MADLDDTLERAMEVLVPAMRSILRTQLQRAFAPPSKRGRVVRASAEDESAVKDIDDVTRARARQLLDRHTRTKARAR